MDANRDFKALWTLLVSPLQGSGLTYSRDFSDRLTRLVRGWTVNHNLFGPMGRTVVHTTLR